MNHEDWKAIRRLLIAPLAFIAVMYVYFITLSNWSDIDYLQRNIPDYREQLRKDAQREEKQIRELREQIRQLQMSQIVSNHSPAKPEEQQ